MTETARSAPGAVAPPGPATLLGAGTVVAVLVADQLAKWLALTFLDEGVAIDILPILSFYLTANPGIAFSFFRGVDGTVLLLGVGLVTLVVLWFWARAREGGKLAAVGFAFIVGGALGNIVDRLIHGHVIDFLLFHIGDRTIFIFNLADNALTLGPILLVIAYLRPARAQPPQA